MVIKTNLSFSYNQTKIASVDLAGGQTYKRHEPGGTQDLRSHTNKRGGDGEGSHGVVKQIGLHYWAGEIMIDDELSYCVRLCRY